jgi:membrane-bound lytic murein transglycosylase A
VSSRLVTLSLAVVIAVALSGCAKPVQPVPLPGIEKDYSKQLAPGQFALRKIEPSQYPKFGDAWYKAKGTGLRRAVQYSIDYLNKPSSQKYYPLGPITHERALNSLLVFQQMLDQANSPEALDKMIRDNFDVYMSVGCDDDGTVLFTGYYTPIFDGSLTRTERFQYPLYRLPPGFQKDSEGNPVGGAYNTRQEIEQGGLLAGNEIVWLPDRFEAYVVTVQGSGFIRMENGQMYEIGYAGHNGRDYTPIGQALIQDGKIPKNKLSLDALIRYFKEHPEEMDQYLYKNERYVFFQESKGGPFGCLGQPVTDYHSIATDKEIFPRACLSFIDTRVPIVVGDPMRPYRSFVLDQDRGAAIRAPGRSDIYMGVGDEAGKIAGFTYSEGKLYYLFVKDGVKPAAAAGKAGGTAEPTPGAMPPGAKPPPAGKASAPAGKAAAPAPAGPAPKPAPTPATGLPNPAPAPASKP